MPHPFLKAKLHRLAQSHPAFLERINWAAVRATQSLDQADHLIADEHAINIERASQHLGPRAK